MNINKKLRKISFKEKDKSFSKESWSDKEEEEEKEKVPKESTKEK